MTTEIIRMPFAELGIPGASERQAEIRITEQLQHFGTLTEQGQYYDERAQVLCDALYRSLPAALWDRLMAKMLAATAEEVGHGKE